MHKLTIYSPVFLSKLRYAIDSFLAYVDDIKIQFESDLDKFLSSENEIKINYSRQDISGVINIKYSEYFEEFKMDTVPSIEGVLSFSQEESGFDFLAATFYLLCRIDELTSGRVDEHGRVPISENILYKNKLHRQPVIDIWIKNFIGYINDFYMVSLKMKSSFSFISTTDVDHIYAYKAKPFYIQLGGFIKDLSKFKIQRLKDRFNSQDPYDRLEEMMKWNRNQGHQLQAFVLCAERSQFDRSLSPSSKVFRSKITALSRELDMGIHPSYISNSNIGTLSKELMRLSEMISQKIVKSRQHFLKLHLPDTYRHLIDQGIEEDYTMGFAEDIGFRAGTSRPFFWYDLEKNVVTHLRIVPFHVMDVTLKKYLALSPSDALKAVQELVEVIKNVDGHFCLIWHNSSFYAEEGWAGWENIYKDILSIAKD